MKKFLKAVTTALVVISYGVTSLLGLGSCAQQTNTTNSSTPTSKPNTTVSSSTTTDSTQDSKPTQEDKSALVSDVVDSVIGNRDFENTLHNALVDLAQKKFDDAVVTEVEVQDFTSSRNGKIVIDVTIQDNGIESTQQLTYEGDTTLFSKAFQFGQNKENAIENELRRLQLTPGHRVVKNSSIYNSIVETFEKVETTFDQQIQNLKSLSVESLKNPQQQPSEEYISVESIVNEAFADIDFDADLMETVQKIFATRAPSNKLNKVYAIDFEIAQDGHFTFYSESTITANNSLNVRAYIINVDTTQLSNFLNLTSNKEEFLNNLLAEYNLSLDSQIVKDSSTEKTLNANLLELINKYNSEKIALENTEKSNIKSSAIFSPKQFSQQEMDELGIDNLNAFAEALLNNTRGEGFDQVQGWTMDDVIATYVSEFSGEAIDYKSRMNILVITKSKILSYELWTQRYYGSTENRYGMILSNNPNIGMKSVEEKAEYGENAIIYSSQSKAKVSEKTNNDRTFEEEFLNTKTGEKWVYVSTPGGEGRPAVSYYVMK